MNRAQKILLIVFAILLVTASIYLALTMFPAPQQPVVEASAAAEIAPDVLLGMDKMVVASGPDALQRVKQSHVGNVEQVKDVAIVHYMKEGGM